MAKLPFRGNFKCQEIQSESDFVPARA